MGTLKPMLIDGNKYFAIVIESVSIYRKFKATKEKTQIERFLMDEVDQTNDHF